MNAEQKIQTRLDELFQHAPISRAVLELKEELMANCVARYADLAAKGMDEDAAIDAVISNIGNVDELITALPYDPLDAATIAREDQQRRSSAVIVSLAVGIYIFAGIVIVAGFMLFNSWTWQAITMTAALLLCIVPTLMLVYNAVRYPRYKRRDDSVVESFKQYNTDAKRSKQIFGTISGLLWVITLMVYFLISFATMAWWITWIIFLVATCIEMVLKLVFDLRGSK